MISTMLISGKTSAPTGLLCRVEQFEQRIRERGEVRLNPVDPPQSDSVDGDNNHQGDRQKDNVDGVNDHPGVYSTFSSSVNTLIASSSISFVDAGSRNPAYLSSSVNTDTRDLMRLTALILRAVAASGDSSLSGIGGAFQVRRRWSMTPTLIAKVDQKMQNAASSRSFTATLWRCRRGSSSTGSGRSRRVLWCRRRRTR